MSEQSRRKELKGAYRERTRQAGVYRIVNTKTGRYLLASSAYLEKIPNKLAFARSTGNIGVLDLRLKPDVIAHGIDAFEIEMLEEFEPEQTATEAEVRGDLAVLESLWKERLDPALAY
jgi:hypothetical protein